MDKKYWHTQTVDKPLFPNIEWSRPEQKSQAGKLGIIGGNETGFACVSESFSDAIKIGVGEVKILLPDNLKKAMPDTITNVIYGASNLSGGLAKQSIDEMRVLSVWATGILLIGDAGRNSETAILYEEFIKGYNGPLTITRDAIDLIKNNPTELIERPNTLIVASFAQLQKIFQNAYYPKVLTFNMQLSNLVETLHKFTITYPVAIAVFFQDQIIIAYDSQVTTTPYSDPMKIWRGTTATYAASYWLWNLTKPLESATASLLN